MKLLRFIIVFAIGTAFLTSCKKDCPDHSIIVDAGAIQQITLPSDNANLNGTVVSGGTSADVYLWVQLSGPNMAILTNNNSLSASASTLVAGTYVFQLQATNSYGETGLDTTSVTVLSPTSNSVTLQPANNPYEGYFATHIPTTWATGSSQIFVEAWTIFGDFFRLRSAIKFDYSALPAGAVVDNATLYLYSDPNPLNGNQVDAQDGPSNSFHIKRITSPWANFTWNAQPTATDVNTVTVPQSTSTTENVIANVTALVNDQLSNENNGFVMMLNTEVAYNIRQFASSHVSNASIHPKLVLQYH